MYKALMNVVSRAEAKLTSESEIIMHMHKSAWFNTLSYSMTPGTDNPNESRVPVVVTLVGFVETGPSRQDLWEKKKIL